MLKPDLWTQSPVHWPLGHPTSYLNSWQIYQHKIEDLVYVDLTVFFFSQLERYNQGGDPDSVAGEFGIHPLYKMLGYFSLIGLLRLHSLLGDYFQAIKVLENVELNKKVNWRVK